jgi:hypothetical protein
MEERSTGVVACPHRYAKRCGREYWRVGFFRPRAPASAKPSSVAKAMADKTARQAVLECIRPAANSAREVNVRFCCDCAGSVGGPFSPPSAMTILVVAHATTHR